MKIAMYGGSFNPPHIGHLIVADMVLDAINYDKLIFVPTNNHPNKGVILGASDVDRFNMIKLMISNNDRFILDDYELKNNEISYSIDTLHYIYDNYHNIEEKISLIIGADLVRSFSAWKEARKISEISNIIVANRNDIILFNEINILSYSMKVVNVPRIDISSSCIRNKIKNNFSFRYFLDKDVYKYILDNNLYK